MTNYPSEFINLFAISFGTLNLFSFILGSIWALSTSCYGRYRYWWLIAGYFATIAVFYAFKAGALR